MRTTIRLEDSLLRRAKKLAAGQGKSLTALIEEALRTLLAHSSNRANTRHKVTLPVSQSRGGPLPGIDLDDSRGLYDLMDGDAPRTAPARVAECPPKSPKPKTPSPRKK